jgi:PAS domain S-box-containing protein
MNGMSGRQAEALQQSRDARAQAQRTRVQTVRVAELVSATQGRVAALLDELAEARPQDAPRLRALSAQARQQADRQRDRAYRCARDALMHAAAQTAATPARRPAAQSGPRPVIADVSLAALWEVIDSSGHGVALVDGHGVLLRASKRLEETFGYQHGELAGQPVEVLVPARRREAHRTLRSRYAQHPRTQLREDRAPMAGLRKDGTVLPVEISLHPVRSAADSLTLAVVRKAAEPPLTLDHATAEFPAAVQAACRDELALLDEVITGLFISGLRLQAPGDIGGSAGRRKEELVDLLDGLLQRIQDHVSAAHGEPTGGATHPGRR